MAGKHWATVVTQKAILFKDFAEQDWRAEADETENYVYAIALQN